VSYYVLIHIICCSVPDGFLSSTIIPIPKGHNANMCDSTNFRGIALSSLFGQTFDNIILDRYCDALLSSELQFGFKANHSTNMCSMVLKETISYYKQHQTPVFCVFLMPPKRLIGCIIASYSNYF